MSNYKEPMKLIDANEMRKFLDRQYEGCHGYMGNKKEIYREALRAVKSYVHSETVVDAEPVKHGHWVKSKDGYHRCSVCKSKRSAIEARYCHYCGSKMDEEVTND